MQMGPLTKYRIFQSDNNKFARGKNHVNGIGH